MACSEVNLKLPSTQNSQLVLQFSEGDRVRVDIPDVTDPDHEEYHGLHGEIVEVLEDDGGSLLRIQFDRGDTADFRKYDLRRPIQ